jgi:hemerythrin-like domain-containing protein
MLRDKNLVPLSHQHQHALALCVRLDRALQAGEVDLDAWQAEFQQTFELEISVHFAAEERSIFPVAARFPELFTVVEELRAEHQVLRDLFARAAARELDGVELRNLLEKLAQHIRKEERQLFEGLQRVMSPEELATLGPILAELLGSAPKACSLQSPATRLRPKQ